VTRTLALWCPDWTFTAAGLGPEVPAVVLTAGKVAACSWAARADGVRRGQRKREAQGRSPGLAVVDDDPARDARAFEPVVDVVATLVPSVEVVRPGLCALPVARAARWFGGEDAVRTRVVADVHARTGVPVETGIADGLFAAVLAARHGTAVAPGATAAFLAPFPVTMLDRPALADVWVRLGIRTLGDLAALPAPDVLDRFGHDGAWAHRLARGDEQRVRSAREVPADLVVESVLDEPVTRVDAAAFVARTLAESLHARLGAHGLTALRVAVEVETEHGETLSRVWRHDGTLTAAALADRVRWQLDGWLSGTLLGERVDGTSGRPTSGITVLRLVPDQLVAADGRQLDLLRSLGRAADDEERATRVDRALTRVQALLGHESVLTAELAGGREPGEQVRLVPWTDPRASSGSAAEAARVLRTDRPWPGRLPAPAPATVLAPRLDADVRDVDGAVVEVSGRCVVSAAPARVSVDDRGWSDVVGWAGPWPVESRWWDAARRRRRARFQVACADGDAWLLVREDGRWFAEARYD
jgi:protein ImuB